ncbi:MAG: hypothetical protein CL878_04520 [Dehalococcoidia bacterium]|nr:hypothetical protein [Dehalococcoidia bacterium]
MRRRHIQRIAFLQDYRNRPESLADEVHEVAGLGYHEVTLSARIGQEAAVVEVARKAAEHGLEVSAFTGFMKYAYEHLVEHPEQKAVFSRDADHEELGNLPPVWGCPYHPDFQQRYLAFLERLARIPNLTEVWVNDEAYFGRDADQLACYCQTCQADWAREFDGRIPRPPFEDRTEKARLVGWRFRRWNAVHGKMKAALNRDRRVRAVFQSGPGPFWDINPWVSGIDFDEMVGAIDGLAVDAYYTAVLPAVGSGLFTPVEMFLSECCRYLRGMCLDEEKVAVMLAQGMSHPEFLRPLDERDGWWAAVVPPALGVDRVTTYTYRLQRASPMHRTFQEAFRLDPYFERTEPVVSAAVVDSVETQCYDESLPARGRENWRLSRMFAVGQMASHYGLPHGYLPSSNLALERLTAYPVVILPNVSCLSAGAREALLAYVRQGGTLVAAGETATRDEVGRPVDGTFLAEAFGIDACVPEGGSHAFAAAGEHTAFAGLPWPEESIAWDAWKGPNFPVLALDHSVRLETSGDTEVLGVFEEAAGPLTGHPALTVRRVGQGYGVFVAGIPARSFTRQPVGTSVLSFSRQVVSQLLLSLVGEQLPLRVRGFPPRVPLQEVRPLDTRWKPTMEFMPSVGEDHYLAVITSYFREPGAFRIEAKLPEGKRCREVRELVSEQPVAASGGSGQTVEIEASLTSEDFLQVYAFLLEERAV